MTKVEKKKKNIPNQGVDLADFDVVERLHRGANLALVGQNIDNECEGVVLLNQLHGRFRGQWVADDTVFVELNAADNSGALAKTQDEKKNTRKNPTGLATRSITRAFIVNYYSH